MKVAYKKNIINYDQEVFGRFDWHTDTVEIAKGTIKEYVDNYVEENPEYVYKTLLRLVEYHETTHWAQWHLKRDEVINTGWDELEADFMAVLVFISRWKHIPRLPEYFIRQNLIEYKKEK